MFKEGLITLNLAEVNGWGGGRASNETRGFLISIRHENTMPVHIYNEICFLHLSYCYANLKLVKVYICNTTGHAFDCE